MLYIKDGGRIRRHRMLRDKIIFLFEERSEQLELFFINTIL